ncbi:MAG TPA: MMPL family transporter, partial [Thermoanaerobaculia bacterium]|nr:MMPL family transporter [Thermoanaerobaculia bacterium]
GVAFLERAEAAARALPGVRSSSSIVGRHRAELPAGPPDPRALAGLARDNRFDRAMGWLSADGRIATVLVETEELPARQVGALTRELERIAAGAPEGLGTVVVGTRSLERALDRSSREIGTIYFPLLLGLSVLLLAATFRDLGGVVVPLAFVALVEGVTLGAMGWAGVELDLVLAILPPLVFAISLASVLHVQIPCRAAEAAGASPEEAVREVYRDKGRALVAAGLSTALGFAALGLSPVPAVRALGLWAGLGLAFQTLASFAVLPALLALAAVRRGLPERALEDRLERLGARLARGAADHRRAILLGFGLLAVAALGGWLRLERESDALRYLPADDPLRTAVERLERRGIGTATLELVVRSPGDAPGLWRTAAGLASLERLELALDGDAGVLGAVGAGGLVAELGASSPFAALQSHEESLEVGLALAASEPEAGSALARFVDGPGSLARLTLFVPHAGYAAIDGLAARAEQLAAEMLPEGTTAQATGLLRVLLALHRSLLATLGRSLALTAAVATIVFALLLGRARDVARALAPNLGPILLLLGGMGWLGVKLDIATAMVASILLGLAVDDTIHTLARYRRRRAEVGARAAIEERLRQTAPAYLLTGAILAAGFGVCALSDFAPIARFGGLAAAGVALAVAADLVLVPALFSRD